MEEKEYKKMSVKELYAKILKLIVENGFKSGIAYNIESDKFLENGITECIVAKDCVTQVNTTYHLLIKMLVFDNDKKIKE